MQQIVDLENSPEFLAENVTLLSIARDAPAELAAGALESGIVKTSLLSDADKKVSASYDVLKWAIPSGEPGHTFILVNQDGTIAWIKDYGAPDNPERTMYVPIEELIQAVRDNLK